MPAKDREKLDGWFITQGTTPDTEGTGGEILCGPCGEAYEGSLCLHEGPLLILDVRYRCSTCGDLAPEWLVSESTIDAQRST